MTNQIKSIGLGGLLLIVGITIGWILKPSHESEKNHDSDSTIDVQAGSEEVWTCSMHPQIRQEEKGICPICEMDLIQYENNLSSNDPSILMMSEDAVKLAQIETTIVGSSDRSQNSLSTINVEGTIELDERSIQAQNAHLAGRIESINVNFEGEYIKAGQKIGTIYSTELLAASQVLITASKFDSKVSGVKDASIQKFKFWNISDQQIEKIIETGQPIETIDIYAEHSGYVLDKKVSLGDHVEQGQTLYTLGQTNRLWLLFNVFESDLKGVRKGQRIAFTTPATGEKKYKARITYIDPLLDPVNRTATIRAEMNNTGNVLKPGMLLYGQIENSIPQSNQNKAITVPGSAVLWTGKSSVVYVKQEADIPTFQFREVETGNQNNDFITILSGLSIGEEIVTHGAFSIDAAAQLNNNYSMMNRSVQIKKEAIPNQIPNFIETTPDDFKVQIDALALTYIVLKDALVATDADAAANATQKVIDKSKEVDMTLVTGEAHDYWMEQLSAISGHGSKIISTDDIEGQRKQFEFLSDAIINSIVAFGTSGKTYYVQYCPMAFDNQGADWVSTKEQIENPYFGDKMMKCGSVKRVVE